MSNYSLTVCIPTLNREEVLVDTLRQIIAQLHSNVQIIVVDQTLEHEARTKEYLEEVFCKHPQCRLENVVKKNLPNARNVGLKLAKGNYILYIDDDVIIDSDFLGRYLEQFQIHPQITAIVGPVETVNGKTADRRNDSPRESACDFLNNLRLPTVEELPNGGLAKWGRGCNMAFRVDHLRQMGGFDERYTGNAFREECDLFARIADSGYKVWFDPNCSLKHIGEVTGGCRPVAGRNWVNYIGFFWIYYRNNARFARTARKTFYLSWETLAAVVQDTVKQGSSKGLLAYFRVMVHYILALVAFLAIQFESTSVATVQFDNFLQNP